MAAPPPSSASGYQPTTPGGLVAGRRGRGGAGLRGGVVAGGLAAGRPPAPTQPRPSPAGWVRGWVTEAIARGRAQRAAAQRHVAALEVDDGSWDATRRLRQPAPGPPPPAYPRAP